MGPIPRGCCVIGCGEAARNDVPKLFPAKPCLARTFSPIPDKDSRFTGQRRGESPPCAHPAACPLGLAEDARSGDAGRIGAKSEPNRVESDPEGRPPPANHTAERHAGSPIQQRPGRQPGLEQTLKRSASNRARCATTGAGGCNPRLRPNPSEGIDLRGRMLGDTETALGRQCPNVL